MAEKFPSGIPQPVPETLAEKAETREEVEARAKKELVGEGLEFDSGSFRFVDEGEKIDKVEFGFVEPRLRIYPEGLPRNPDWKLFSKDITAEDKKNLGIMFDRMKDYLGALIITDNFTYHDDRGRWEREHRSELSPETWEIYKNNRLGLTNASRPLAFLNYLKQMQSEQEEGGIFVDQKTMSQLEAFVKMMPAEVCNGDIYGQTSLSRKIEIANEEMPRVFSAVIRTLGERTHKSKN